MSTETTPIPLKELGINPPTTERPVSPKELNEQLFITLGKRKEERPKPFSEREYDDTGVPILKPLKSVTLEVTEKNYQTGNDETKEVNFDEDLNEEFKYLSRTHKLETGTAKTQLLQGVVDRMLNGINLQTRVVVMNKGEDPNAFVFADGTIFVSQSLINKLGSLDEVAAVLGHEIEHLVNKTFENKFGSHDIHKTGVGWLHETVSDQFTPSLLEKADLNSLAFSSAIKKVSGAERGIIHQSGIARSAENVGQHFFRHYRTSNKSYTPKSEVLKGEVTKTNYESFDEFYRKKEWVKSINLEHLRELLLNLHPTDFQQAYRNIFFSQHPSSNWKEYRIQHEILKCANGVIFERLEAAGFNNTEIKTFLLSVLSGSGSEANLYLLENSEQFEEIIDILKPLKEGNKLERMSSILFGNSEKYPPSVMSLQGIFRSHFYVKDLEQRKFGIPVTEDTLLKFLTSVTEAYSDTAVPSEITTDILLGYVSRVYLPVPEEAGVRVDDEQIRTFFKRVKEAGIKVDTSRIEHYIKEGQYVKTIRGNINLSLENQQIVKDVFCEVFEYTPRSPEGKVDAPTFEKIDALIAQMNVDLERKDWDRAKNNLGQFIRHSRDYFIQNQVDDDQRLVFIEYLDKKVSELQLNANYSIKHVLATDKYLQYDPELVGTIDQNENERLLRFNLRTYLALQLFSQDGNEFYSHMEKVMSESGIDIQNLSWEQTVNLCQSFFVISNKEARYIGNFYLYGPREIESLYFFDHVNVNNFDRFFNLPFLRHILESKETLQFQTIKELNEFTAQFLKRSFVKGSGDDLFADNPRSLILGLAIRENFLRILERGISEEDYADLYQFIENYYSGGVIKNQLLTEINKRYLQSTKVPFEEKVDYLLKYYDSVGLEGTAILGEQISDLPTFINFRSKLGERFEQYMKGSKVISIIALSDFVSSFLSGGFEQVLESSQEGNAREKSTELAQNWFQYHFTDNYGSERRGVDYDKQTGKFIFGKSGRVYFQTIADSIATLRNLSLLQRSAISFKLLTERNGALYGEFNRSLLANILTKALNLKKGFIADVLTTACKTAKPDWISIPASKMLAPLLFRSYDSNAIDFTKLGKLKIAKKEIPERKKYPQLNSLISSSEITQITNSNTRAVTFFGVDYREYPNSAIAQLAQEADRQYFLTNERLSSALQDVLSEGEESLESGVDPSLEAIISAVEASGALGVRALQLASQMMQFPPAVEARLARTLDSNAGLAKIAFWENLEKLSQENEQVREFLGKVRVGDYLGGGSLYTTYAAILEENGQTEEIVLKMLNPNAEAIVEESYQIVRDVLEQVVSQKGASGNSEHAKIAMLLIDLAKQWCLADINDPTFIQDDDQFKNTINFFNQATGVNLFYKPDRRLNTYQLKSETRADGQTLNKFLKNKNVSLESKKTAVEQVSRFFLNQLRHAPTFTDGDKTYRLIHADPHTGNYMIGENGQARIGIIDRHMYLKVGEKDVRALEKMVSSGNDNDFVYSFIDRVLDINDVPDDQRNGIRNGVFGKLALEYAKQRIRGKVDRLSLMKTMLSQLSEAEVVEMVSGHVGTRRLDVPLNLRLMIRNIGAFQELGRRYGVDFEHLYKESAKF